MADYLLGLPLAWIVAILVRNAVHLTNAPEEMIASATTAFACIILLWDIFSDGFLGDGIYIASSLLALGAALSLLVWLHERRGVNPIP